MHGFAKGFIGTLAFGLAALAPAAFLTLRGPALPPGPRAAPRGPIVPIATSHPDVTPAPRTPVIPSMATTSRLRFGVEPESSTWPGVPDTGDETLFVRLFDAETGEPVAMGASLWRIGLPETRSHAAGDQDVRSVGIGLDGLEVQGLPPGRYRLDCAGQRRGAASPPGFVVEGGRTEFAALVRPPRTRTAFVAVFDPSGVRMTRGTLRFLRSCSRSRGSDPRWAQPRREKGADRRGRWGRGVGCSVGGTPDREVVAEAHGFALGDIREETRGTSATRHFEVSFTGRSRVRTVVTSREADAPRYVGLTVPHALLVRDVTLPDGSPVVDAAPHVAARCIAVLLGDGQDPAEVARGLGVEVTVRVPEHERLRFVWRAGREAPRRVMRRVR